MPMQTFVKETTYMKPVSPSAALVSRLLTESELEHIGGGADDDRYCQQYCQLGDGHDYKQFCPPGDATA